MAKKIKGSSPSEPLEDLDLDSNFPPLEEETAPASRKDSTVNLDEYGIWVKGEPEDFKQVDSFDEQEMALEDLSPEEPGEGAKGAAGGGMIDDLDIPEEESLSGLEAPGAEPEIILDEEPAAAAAEEPALEMEAMEPAGESALEMETIETAGEEPALEMDMTEDMPALEEEATPVMDEEVPSAMDDEIPLDENFGSLEEEAIGEETVVREEPAAEAEPEAGLIGEMEPEAAGDYEEVSLDDLGIEISAEPPEEVTAKVQTKRQASPPPPKPAAEEAGPHVIDDEFASLSLDLEGEGEAGAPVEEKGGLELDELDLPEEEAVEIASAGGAEEESAALPEETFEDLTGPEGLEEIPELELGPEEPAVLETGAGGDFGEEIEVPLSDNEAIAESEEEELGSLEPGLGAAAAGPSDSVLKNIEAELKSIKTELTQLKSELSVLRGRKAGGDEGGKIAKAGSGAGGDFFEEEEDETIALTGEELDNILVTADIKEETKAEHAEPSAGAEEPVETELELGEDIIGYEEEPASGGAPAAAQDEALEEISLEEVPVDKGSGAAEGEIEIEIPELENGPEEILAGGGPEEEIAPIEDLGPEGGLETMGGSAPSLEDTLEEVGELELESGPAEEGEPIAPRGAPSGAPQSDMQLPSGLKEEIKSVLGYMDQLLESLPEEKIEEFAKSEYFSIYKKLFEELGLVS